MSRCWLIFVGLAFAAYLQNRGNAEDDTLKNKIVRATLNQNVPAVIRVGTNGVTSLEFPYKVEAIDGYGFSPTPNAGDGFQISYAKGNNYFSVRAVKPGVTGNLTVVLDQKLYSLFFQESSDPVFATIFVPVSRLETWHGPKSAEGTKVSTPKALADLIDKAKGYSALKSSSPELFERLQITEPEKKNSVAEGVETVIRRVIRDNSSDSLAFEIEIDNRSAKDFLYDPGEIQVRVRDQFYSGPTAGAAGTVKAQTSATFYLAVAGTATEGRDDLASENDFDLVVREATVSANEGMKYSEPPRDFLPTATTVGPPEPVVKAPLRREHGFAKLEPRKVRAIHVSSRKGVRKAGSMPQNKPKAIVAKTQKSLSQRLFGWL